MTYDHVNLGDKRKRELRGLAYVSIGTADTERVDANPLLAILRERSRHHWHLELLLRKWNYSKSVFLFFSPWFFSFFTCLVRSLYSGGTGLKDLLFGFGVSNLMFGGIILCSNARTHLIKLLSPEEPSEWPTFGFTEPTYTPFSAKTLPTAPTSIGSPVEVPVP